MNGSIMWVLKSNLKYEKNSSLCLVVIPLLMESVLTGGLQSKNTITKALSAIQYTELCVLNLSHGLWCAFDVMWSLQIVEDGLSDTSNIEP